MIKCNQCEYFVPWGKLKERKIAQGLIEQYQEGGHCRIKAPTHSEKDYYEPWPVVREVDGCGEGKAPEDIETFKSNAKSLGKWVEGDSGVGKWVVPESGDEE